MQKQRSRHQKREFANKYFNKYSECRLVRSNTVLLSLCPLNLRLNRNWYMLEFRSVCGLLHSLELVNTKLVDGTAQLKQVTWAKNDNKVFFLICLTHTKLRRPQKPGLHFCPNQKSCLACLLSIISSCNCLKLNFPDNPRRGEKSNWVWTTLP